MLIDHVKRALADLDREATVDVDAMAAAVVEVIAEWLECDDIRPTVYDGVTASGPMTKNVGRALARRARYGSAHEPGIVESNTSAVESGAIPGGDVGDAP